MSLTKTAGKMEAVVLSFTPEQRQAVVVAFSKVQEAVTALAVIPPVMWDLCGLAVAEAVGRKAFRATWRSMVSQFVDGAPTLLGPHREQLIQTAEEFDHPKLIGDGKVAGGG